MQSLRFSVSSVVNNNFKYELDYRDTANAEVAEGSNNPYGTS